MSYDVTRIVWDKSKQKGTMLLLLLAIADHADSDGIAYPSIKYLANKTNMTPRNTQMSIKKLVESGELEVRMGGGRLANTYTITLVRGEAGFRGEAEFTPDMKQSSPQGCNTVHPNQSFNKSCNKSSIPDVDDVEDDPLVPATPGGKRLFLKLGVEAKARKMRGPKKFESLAQRDKFLEAEKLLPPERLEEVISLAILAGARARKNAINYIHKVATSPKPVYKGSNGGKGGDSTRPLPEGI
jgi:hypothetical protein